MCGRFSQLKLNPVKAAAGELAQLEPELELIRESYNVAPTQLASVLLDSGSGLHMQSMAWGLLPSWAKAKSFQGNTFNARIETVDTKPAFRAAFKARRCIIPMAGYYEWTLNPEDGKKDPWFIHSADGAPLWAAGLWEGPSPLLPVGNAGTFTVITGDSSGVSADIHDRMPITIQPDLFDEWLIAPPDQAMAILVASTMPKMEAYRVSRRVNTPRNNDQSLLEPLES